MSNEAIACSKDVLVQYSPGLEHVNMADLKRLLKPELANICIRALHFVEELLSNVETLKNSNSSLQNRLIKSQQQVISTQAELSECKTEQLETLRKTVETSVLDSVKTVETSLVDSVKTELQSYSSAVQRTPPNEQTFSSEAQRRGRRRS